MKSNVFWIECAKGSELLDIQVHKQIILQQPQEMALQGQLEMALEVEDVFAYNYSIF